MINTKSITHFSTILIISLYFLCLWPTQHFVAQAQSVPLSCSDAPNVVEISLASLPISSSSILYINNSNTQTYIGKRISSSGVLKFGQTLIVDGLTAIDGTCGGIHGILLICPGTTIIVRNSNVKSIIFESTEFVRNANQCDALCEFPPGIDENNIPSDTDPAYMVNVSFYNNTIRQDEVAYSPGIMFFASKHPNCTMLNNTRYQVQIYNNNISVCNRDGITLALGNYISRTNSDTIHMAFFRNLAIRNNTVMLRKGKLSNWGEQQFSPFSVRPFFIESTGREVTPAVGVEGTFDFVGNTYSQECTNHAILYERLDVVTLRLTTFGAHPSFLPLRINASFNTFFGAKNHGLISFEILHARVGYYPNGYTFTRNDTNFVQSKNPQKRNDVFDLLPPSLAPILLVENNSLHINNSSHDYSAHIVCSVFIDERAPPLREFIEAMFGGSSSSSFQQALDKNSTLFNLYWYPEKQVMSSLVLRNNLLTSNLPKMPMSYWTSGGGNSGKYSDTAIYIQVGNLRDGIGEALESNLQLPVDRFTGQVLPEAKSQFKYNFSSLMFTFEKLIIENNNISAVGAHAVNFVEFRPYLRARILLVKNCKFHAVMNQEGLRGTPVKIGGVTVAQRQFSNGLTLRKPVTVESLEISSCSWNIEKLTEDFGLIEWSYYFRSDSIFGLVSFKFINNVVISRCVSMSINGDFVNFASNHFTSAFDFATTTSSFEPLYEIRNVRVDTIMSSATTQETIQSVVYSSGMSLPGGRIIFDNISALTRSASASGAVIFQGYSRVEADSLIISNINLVAEALREPRAVRFQANFFFIRKEIIITNITQVSRPFKYGEFLVVGNSIDQRPIAAVFLTGNFDDPTATSNDKNLEPPYKNYFRNPSVQQTPNGAVADKPFYFEISNIFLKLEPGIVVPASAVHLSARGLNCRSSSTYYHSSNQNNNDIQLVMNNITFFGGAAHANISSLGTDPLKLLLAQNAVLYRVLVTLVVWPITSWTFVQDASRRNLWDYFQDPRINQTFPSSSSSSPSMTASPTFVVQNSLLLAEHAAVTFVVSVLLGDSNAPTKMEAAPMPNSQPFVAPAPKIVALNLRCETATFSSSSFSLSSNGGAQRFSNDLLTPPLDMVQLWSTSSKSSFLDMRPNPHVASLQLENVFAPLVSQLWVSTALISALSGLQKLIISPSSNGDFTASNYFRFLKERGIFASRKYLNNIGTCGVFFGNRPISNEDRVISTMAGSALSPFDKKPISVHSKNYFDQIQFTPCLTETKSKSMSKTRHHGDEDRGQSRTSETISQSSTKIVPPVKNPMIETVSQSVASALVANDVLQTTSMVSVAVFASISSSPALGFTIAHQQAMLDFAKKAMQGDCRGLLPATKTEQFSQTLSNPLGAADSPTQMSIGGQNKLMSYYVGAVIGNFILTFSLVILSQGIGTVVMMVFQIKNNKIRNFTRNNVAFQMMKERCGFRKDEDLVDSMRRVFATSYVSLTLFFCLSFLLTPTLSSSLVVLVAAKNDPKLKNHEVSTGLKILALIIALIFCVICVAFVAWGVLIRKQRREKYRLNKLSRAEQEQVGVVAKMCKAEGEWAYPNPSGMNIQNIFDSNKKSRNNNNNNKKYELCYLNYLIAEPTFESYRDTIWFSLVEVVTAILIALPPFFAQFATSGQSSCLVHGIMLLIFILVYTVILIWKNPFKLRIMRIMNPLLALQQLLIVIMTLVVFAVKASSDDSFGQTANDSQSDDDQRKDSWLWKVIIIPMGFEGLMGMMMIGAASFPFMMFLKKLKGRMERGEGDGNATKTRNRRDDHHRRRRRNEDLDDREMMMMSKSSSSLLFSRTRRGDDDHRRNHRQFGDDERDSRRYRRESHDRHVHHDRQRRDSDPRLSSPTRVASSHHQKFERNHNSHSESPRHHHIRSPTRSSNADAASPSHRPSPLLLPQRTSSNFHPTIQEQQQAERRTSLHEGNNSRRHRKE